MDDVRANTLGRTIRERRCALGWTQEELAERVANRGDEAFRQSDVSRLERGKVGLPRRDRLERVAGVLGLSVGELLARSGWAGAETAPGPTLPLCPPTNGRGSRPQRRWCRRGAPRSRLVPGRRGSPPTLPVPRSSGHGPRSCLPNLGGSSACPAGRRRREMGEPVSPVPTAMPSGRAPRRARAARGVPRRSPTVGSRRRRRPDDPRPVPRPADGRGLRGHLLVPPAALAEVRRLAPDVILLDFLIGRADDGWRFLRRLKADPTTGALPVFVGGADHALVDRVRDRLTAWACGALRKPFDVDHLLTMLHDRPAGAPPAAGEAVAGERTSGARPA